MVQLSAFQKSPMFLVLFPLSLHLTQISQQPLGSGLTLAGGQSGGRAGQDWEDLWMTAVPSTMLQLTELLQAEPPVLTD